MALADINALRRVELVPRPMELIASPTAAPVARLSPKGKPVIFSVEFTYIVSLPKISFG